MEWWSKFDAVIRDWVRKDPQSVEVWNAAVPSADYGALQRQANRGQIAATADIRTAVWEALLYQRGHIDAFIAVIEPKLRNWRESHPSPTLGILDLGCGTGTVAFALEEFFGGSARLHYVGYDHHAPTRALCESMVADQIAAHGGTLYLTDDLANAAQHAITTWPAVDRMFVTANYFLCQLSVPNSLVPPIAEQTARLVTARGDTRLVIADAALSWSKAPAVSASLRARADIAVEDYPSDTYMYEMKFPDLIQYSYRQTRYEQVEGHYAILRSV